MNDEDVLFQGLMNEMTESEILKMLLMQLKDEGTTFEYQLEGGSTYSVDLGCLLDRMVALNIARQRMMQMTQVVMAVSLDVMDNGQEPERLNKVMDDSVDEYELLRGVSAHRASGQSH